MGLFREECKRAGRPYDPSMVAAARALQMVRNEMEREEAYATRAQTWRVIGDLARGETPPDDVRKDDSPLLGTPEEIAVKLERLRAGGVETILLVDPKASVAGLQAFAQEVMPRFRVQRPAAAE